MNGIKLITKLEYDLIISRSVDYFDTYDRSGYPVGSFVTLRCYFTSVVSDSGVDLTVLIKNVSSISFNRNSGITLCRIHFELL
jgi:hypothetical protein